MGQTFHTMQCDFCQTPTSIEAAMDDGWVPYYWHRGTQCERDAAVCPACTARHLIQAGHGDFEYIPCSRDAW